MFPSCRFAAFALASTALLGGCAVYVPTTPSTPLLRSQGEVEVAAAVRGLSSVETSAAWSPAPHLLLTAEAALQTSEGSETRGSITTDFRNEHRQGGLGVGAYRLLRADQSVYLAAVGGLGLAAADIYDSHFEPFGVIFGGAQPLAHYEARYLRTYGQVYAAKFTPGLSYGASLRGTFVSYSQLQRDGQAVGSPTRFYFEPTFFLRVGQRALQGQFTAGYSQPLGLDRTSPDRRNISPVTALLSAGVVLRPHLLGKRTASIPAR